MHSFIYHIVLFFVQLVYPIDTTNQLPFISLSFQDVVSDSLHVESLDSLLSNKNISVLDQYNIALAYYKLKDTSQANEVSYRIIEKQSGVARTQGYLMLADLALQKKDTAKAINLLADGILKTKRNSELLYNFELLKRKFKNTQNQPPQSPQDQKSLSATENSQAEKSDKKEDELETSTPPKISRKQALQILETLKEKEILFIPKSSDSTKNSNDYGKM